MRATTSLGTTKGGKRGGREVWGGCVKKKRGD